MTKFISPDYKHPYLLKLSEYLDIEFSQNLEHVRNSDKALILWNVYSYVINPKLIWKYETYRHFVDNGKKAYIVERGALPDTIMIDNNGFLCDSKSYNKDLWDKKLSFSQELAVTIYKEYLKTHDNSLEPQINGRTGKFDFYNNLNIDSDKKKVFVPMQVVNDSVILLWSDWVGSLFNFYRIINDLAKKNPDIEFLVKNHPVQLERNEGLFEKKHSNIKMVDNYHYKDCIDYSDCVVTINSGLGLQAMAWNKPVIICGNAFYENKYINTKVDSADGLNFLLGIFSQPSEEDIDKFLFYLVFKFYSNCSMRKTGNNRSVLDNVSRIVYYDEGINVIKDKKFESKKINMCYNNVLDELLSILNKSEIYPCFLEETCKDVMKGVPMDKERFFKIELDITDDLKSKLINKNFEILDGIIKKEDTIIKTVKPVNLTTKEWKYNGFSIRVPCPVLKYLKDMFGRDWRLDK